MATVLWPNRSLTILGVDAVGKRKRRARMPQVVEADTRQREGGQAVKCDITDVGMEQGTVAALASDHPGAAE